MTSWRATAVRASGVLGACALAIALSTTAAVAEPAAGPTGSRAGIALFRAAAHATNALPAYIQSQSGYVRISDSLGPKRTAHWAWGWDQFQPGYYPAIERIVIAQRHGRTVWIDDVLTASTKGCHSPRCRQAVPIQLVITRTQAFYGLISSGSTASCFVREPLRHVPYAAGGAWWSTLAGHYDAPTPSRSSLEVTSQFTIGGQAVVESDWVARSSHLFDKSVLHIARGRAHPAFSYSNSDARLARAPHLPPLTLCS